MKLRALTAGLALLATGTVIGVGTQQFAAADVSSGDRPVFVPIETCRLVDTREAPEFNVGPRTTPLAREDTHVVDAQQPGTDCTGLISTDASALSLNVTVPTATEESFVTIWADGPRPDASSLNPQPGQLVFNAVTVDLAADQTFRIFNNRGNTNIIVDVNGYYENHDHDDRYYTETEVDGRFDQQKMINIVTVRDINSPTADIGKGPLQFRSSFILPPDYTAGTDLRLELVYFHYDITPTACLVELNPDAFESIRPSTASSLDDDGGSVSDGLEFSGQDTITFTGSSTRQIQTLTAVISQPGTIPFEAGDAIDFGLFVNAYTCDPGAVGTHSAAIYYD